MKLIFLWYHKVKLYIEVCETIRFMGKTAKTLLKLILVIGMLGAFIFLTAVDIYSAEDKPASGLYGIIKSHHAIIMGILGIFGIIIGGILYSILSVQAEK